MISITMAKSREEIMYGIFTNGQLPLTVDDVLVFETTKGRECAHLQTHTKCLERLYV